MLLVTTELTADVPGAGPGGVPDDAPGGPVGLADVWTAAAPRCTVGQVVLPGRPAAQEDVPVAAAARERSVVIVPTTALGLRSVPEPSAGDRAGIAARVGEVDLVVVHVELLDTAALHDGAVAEAARAAAPHAVPVVVLTGSDRTTRRALAAAGVAGVHEVGEPWAVARVARVARTWCPPEPAP